MKLIKTMSSEERESLSVPEDVDFRITATQQALASCTGAVLTSLLGIKIE